MSDIKSKGFNLSIFRILKGISKNHGITSNAKKQLNSFMCILAQILSDLSYSVNPTKTITSSHIETAVKLLLAEDCKIIENTEHSFIKNIIETAKEKENTFENYMKNNQETKEHKSRQEKANLLIAPSTVEKFLRNTKANMITKCAPVFLSSILQSFCTSLLETATRMANDYSRIRISIRDLELAVNHNDYLRLIFQKYKIQFIGGGVVPDIQNHKKDFIQKHEKTPIKEIKKYQRINNCLILQKTTFRKLIRDTVSRLNMNDQKMKISENAFIILQYYVEQFIVSFLYDANLIAKNSQRVKILPEDIVLLCKLRKYETE